MSPKPQRLVTKNLLYSIRTAVGSDLFRHCYVINDQGQEVDVFENGQLSCASVVSGILALNDLIDKIHSTVSTTLKTMQERGWIQTNQPVPGCVIHWPVGEEGHEHIGFYIDEQTAISNSSEQGVPALHGLSLPDGRQPNAYYTHPNLLK